MVFNFSEYFLTENRVEFLKKNLKDIDTSHDEHAVHKDTHAIIDHFAEHGDPSQKKSHTQWIVNQYNKKNIRQEDAPAIKETLGHFDAHKGKLEKKDINQYKHISDVRAAVAPHIGTASTKAEAKTMANDEGHKKLFDNGKVSVYHLKSAEASKNIYGGGAARGGTGTDWCTAARSSGNMYDSYAKSGKLHTFHVAGDENSPYQHHTNGQFMDRNDHEVDQYKFVTKHPELAGAHPKLSAEHFAFSSGSDEEVNNMTSHQQELNQVWRHPKMNPDKLVEFHKKGMASSLVNPNFPHKEIDSILKQKEPHQTELNHIAMNPSITGEHISKIRDLALGEHSKHIGDVTRYSILDSLDSHPNLKGEDLDKVVSDQRSHGRVLENPNLNQDHLHKILDSSNSNETKVRALQNPAINSGHVIKALNSGDKRLEMHASMHPKLPQETHMDIVNGNNEEHKFGLAENPNVSHEALHRLVTHDNKDISRQAANNPNLTPGHLNSLMGKRDDDLDGKTIRRAFSNKAIKPEDMHTLYEKHKDRENVDEGVLFNKNILPKTLHSLWDNSNSNSIVRSYAIDHPKADSALLHKGIDTHDHHDIQSVSNHLNLDASHVEKLYNSGERNAIEQISNRTNLKTSVVDKLVDLADTKQKGRMINWNNSILKPHNIDKIYDHAVSGGHMDIALDAVRHPATGANTLIKAAGHSDSYLAKRAVGHDNVTKEVQLKGLDHPDVDVRKASVSKGFNEPHQEVLEKALKDSHPDVRERANQAGEFFSRRNK